MSADATLSDYDRAWLVINYPGKSGLADWDLDKAFKTLNIPLEPASQVDPRRSYADFISRKCKGFVYLCRIYLN